MQEWTIRFGKEVFGRVYLLERIVDIEASFGKVDELLLRSGENGIDLFGYRWSSGIDKGKELYLFYAKSPGRYLLVSSGSDRLAVESGEKIPIRYEYVRPYLDELAGVLPGLEEEVNKLADYFL